MKRPNIIMIMTDDQGYGDLSCMGATDFVTPYLDALAQSGVRFTDFYSNSPVCSPSRAALLTGRYPCNAGVRSILSGVRTTTGISPQAPTIAAALKKIGYRTGHIGKWHLGLAPRSRPNANGFDYFFGFMAGCIDYYSHIFYWKANVNGINPTHDLWENETEVYRNGEYFTELVTRKSVEFIERSQTDSDRPFVLYVGYNAPHYPMHAPDKFMRRFDHLPWDRQVMAAMISCVDDGVGEIVAALKRRGLYEDTVVYFQSDNGPSRESRNWLDGTPDAYYGGTSGGLKGHKFSLFEGGIRVPALLSWPGRVPSNQVVSEPCAAMDLFPTLLGLAGGDPGEYELDGLDILPVVTRGARGPHEQIFWEMGRQTAVRCGDYKLVLNGQLEETQPAQAPVFLANLRDDPGERVNLSSDLPKLRDELTRRAEEWRRQVEERWSLREETSAFR